MNHNFSRLAVACCFCATLTTAFGAKDKDAVARVTRAEPFKGKTSFALGAFRVAFITEDKVTSVARGGSTGGASSLMTGELVGVDHALMQKISDEIYADFLKQATGKGLTIVDSVKLAQISTVYSGMEAAENFSEGRLGTVVIPTGQRSVTLAADNSAKAQRGAANMMAAIHDIGVMNAKADANKAFPEASKEAGVPVLGVTIVVNFANFKGGVSRYGTTAKATILAGATIDGSNGVTPATSIVGWDSKTYVCAACMGQVALIGQVHSNTSIGALETHSTMKKGDHIANSLGALTGSGGQTKKRGAVLTADPSAYETNVLVVAAQANQILLSGLSKGK